MKIKIIETLVGALLLTIPALSSAQISDGSYQGTLQCGPLLINPKQGPWQVPITITISGNKLSWLRSSSAYAETGYSEIHSGRVDVNAEGAWYPSDVNKGSWKTVANLNLEGNTLSGIAIMSSTDGTVRFRDCNVSVMVNSQPSSTSRLNESKIAKTVKQLDSQVNNLLAKTSVNTANSALIQPTLPNKGQQTKASNVAPTVVSEVPASKPAHESSKKPTGSIAQYDITPDMCVDGICVEQDFGQVPTNLAWKSPEPMLNTKQLSGAQKSAYLDGVKRGRGICSQANGAIWGEKVDQLCEYLIFGNNKPSEELIAFFRDNKLPVCDPGRTKFKLALTTPLGSVRFEVDFGKDGRPKVRQVVKQFILLNDTDKAGLRKLIQDKHPYRFSNPPWGGSVEYDDGMHGIGPDYRLNGRSSIFANSRIGPDTGQCAIASKSLSVK